MVCPAISPYSFGATTLIFFKKTRKEVCPALDNYGQSCFVRSDFSKNEVCLQDTHDAPHLTIRNYKQVNLVILFVRPDIDTWFVRLSPHTVLELQL
jgi:hypothetical protein